MIVNIHTEIFMNQGQIFLHNADANNNLYQIGVRTLNHLDLVVNTPSIP
jgi:hypothetical protein